MGPTFAQLAGLNSDDRGTGPDLDGSNSVQTPLAYTQPSRWAARYGIIDIGQARRKAAERVGL